MIVLKVLMFHLNATFVIKAEKPGLWKKSMAIQLHR